MRSEYSVVLTRLVVYIVLHGFVQDPNVFACKHMQITPSWRQQQMNFKRWGSNPLPRLPWMMAPLMSCPRPRLCREYVWGISHYIYIESNMGFYIYIYSIIWLLFCWHFFMIHAWNGKWERSLSTNLAGADSWRWSTCTYPCANRSWLFCHCPSARHETLTSKAVGFVWTMTYDASHMIVALLRLTSSRWPHRRPSVRNWRRDRSSCDSIQVHPNTIYLLYITSTCR
jgi:hypothetical protein